MITGLFRTDVAPPTRFTRGFSRGGAGFNRGGPAASGSFGQNRPVAGLNRGEYDARGPAANGNLGMQYPNLGERRDERQERREERRDERQQEHREDWQEYGEDYYGGGYYYDDGYYGDYAEGEEAVVYWTLPCTPNVIVMGGVTYYVCSSTWYTRAYSDGDVVYTVVPNPTGH